MSARHTHYLLKPEPHLPPFLVPSTIERLKSMPKFYESISDGLRDWALRQTVFFVASAPLRGRHINLSPKGLPDCSFAILGPNEAAYIDSTGSGCETISHVRENGRITVMFCSFDPSPRILRMFCIGSVIEWNQPAFSEYSKRMGKTNFVGARAIVKLDVFKVQTSCGYGVPQLALAVDPETNEPKPYLRDRKTLIHASAKKVDNGQIQLYQQEWNAYSLDGLPALHTALKDKGQCIWLVELVTRLGWYRDELDMMKSTVFLLFVGVMLLRWAEYL